MKQQVAQQARQINQLQHEKDALGQRLKDMQAQTANNKQLKDNIAKLQQQLKSKSAGVSLSCYLGRLTCTTSSSRDSHGYSSETRVKFHSHRDSKRAGLSRGKKRQIVRCLGVFSDKRKLRSNRRSYLVDSSFCHLISNVRKRFVVLLPAGLCFLPENLSLVTDNFLYVVFFYNIVSTVSHDNMHSYVCKCCFAGFVITCRMR